MASVLGSFVHSVLLAERPGSVLGARLRGLNKPSKVTVPLEFGGGGGR